MAPGCNGFLLEACRQCSPTTPGNDIAPLGRDMRPADCRADSQIIWPLKHATVVFFSQEQAKLIQKTTNVNPSPYPANNSEEIRAVHTLLALLDVKHVKPDVKILDTTPNHDGYLEIVDEKQIPLGKLSVQIRKIPDRTRRLCSFDQGTTVQSWSMSPTK
jgi:hypothetical protein